MSLSAPKNIKTNSNTTRIRRINKKNEKLLAIDECKRLYQKYYAYPSSSLLKQLNNNYLKLFLDRLAFNDISIISQLLTKYFFFQQIEIYPSDPDKIEPSPKRKIYRPPVLTPEEKSKIEKEKKLKEHSTKNMINKLIISLSKNITLSNSIILFALNNIEFTQKSCEYLSKAISNNKSLKSISITNSNILLNSYELLLESLLSHKQISYLDLSNNNFGDKYGKMISRMIVTQAQRRDQVVWFYGLRNEIPLNNDYKKGLILINLNGNNLGKDSAECISSALYADQYIRAIYLNNNDFDNDSCKKFIYMMRQNLTLLTIDLRGNPGYDNSIHSRLVMKMSKNIRYLYQQFKKGEYTEEEFESFKLFIDVTFFDVDIPQNVVEFYNNNLPEITEEDHDNNQDNEKHENRVIKTDVVKSQNEIKIKIGDEEINDNDNYMDKKYNNTTSNVKNIKKNGSVNIFEENKKLHDENILLKQQIIELKALNLQKHLNNGKNINNNNINYNNTSNNNNNESQESKSDIEKDYHKIESLINELNELMNKIEKKKSKKKLINQNDNKDTDIKQNEKNNNYIKKYDTGTNTNQETRDIGQDTRDKIKGEKEYEIDNIHTNNNNNNNIDLIYNKNGSDYSNNNSSNNIITKYESEKKTDKIIENKNNGHTEENENENEKDKESSNSHFVDENGNVYNFDDLTEEEKMIILQQQLILQKLQQEAEARGEEFDPKEYIEFLEKQAREEEEEEEDEELKKKNSSNKLNKSF